MPSDKPASAAPGVEEALRLARPESEKQQTSGAPATERPGASAGRPAGCDVSGSRRACVIGGFDCAIDLPLYSTVETLRARAVEEMHERLAPETWECRDAKGYWLEPRTQLGAVANWPIYFNQPIGWGG